MIREFTPAEDAEVERMQEEMRIGAWGVPIGFRAGLKAGVRRAIAAAEAVPYRAQLDAIRKLLEE